MLVKVSGRRAQLPEEVAVIRKAVRYEVNDVAIALDLSLDTEELGAEELVSLAIAQVSPDDDVDAAGLVLKGYEHHAACSIGTLPAGHQASSAGAAAVRHGPQFFRCQVPEPLQLLAQ